MQEMQRDLNTRPNGRRQVGVALRGAGNLCEAREVNEGEVHDVFAVDAKDDGVGRDALGAPGNAVCLSLCMCGEGGGEAEEPRGRITYQAMTSDWGG